MLLRLTTLSQALKESQFEKYKDLISYMKIKQSHCSLRIGFSTMIILTYLEDFDPKRFPNPIHNIRQFHSYLQQLIADQSLAGRHSCSEIGLMEEERSLSLVDSRKLIPASKIKYERYVDLIR